MAEKVKFGLSDVHIGEYGVDTTTTPMEHIPGAVNLSISPEVSQEPFYADNIVYHIISGQSSISAQLEMALIPDDIKVKYLGYKRTADGSLVQLVGKQDYVPFNMSFKFLTDSSERVVVLYNVTAGAITDEFHTMEGSATPVTETMPLTIAGDAETKVWKMVVAPENGGYATALTNPAKPTPATEPDTEPATEPATEPTA